MATTSYLSQMFGRSPIKPMQAHMREVFECVRELKPLFNAVIEQDIDRVRVAQETISDLEHNADRMKKELRNNLPKGLFMPIDRRDLLEVLLMQDNMANQCKDVAGLILGRKMALPPAMHTLFGEYVEHTIAAAGVALNIINELDELVETGFRGPEVDRVEKMIDELNATESLTDAVQIRLRAILFGLEDQLRPTDVMFTYRLIEWVGNVADHAEKVGSRLQLVLAK